MVETKSAWGIVMRPKPGGVDSGTVYDRWRTRGVFGFEDRIGPLQGGFTTMTFKTRREARRHLHKHREQLRCWGYCYAAVAKLKITVEIERVESHATLAEQAEAGWPFPHPVHERSAAK